MITINNKIFNISVPLIPNKIIDVNNILSFENKKRINRLILEKSPIDFGIVIVNDLKKYTNKTMVDFSKDLFNFWKLGSKDVNDGILYTIIKNKKEHQLLLGSGIKSYLCNNFIKNLLVNQRDLLIKEDFGSTILIIVKEILIEIEKKKKKSWNKKLYLTFGLLFFIVLIFFSYIKRKDYLKKKKIK